MFRLRASLLAPIVIGVSGCYVATAPDDEVPTSALHSQLEHCSSLPQIEPIQAELGLEFGIHQWNRATDGEGQSCVIGANAAGDAIVAMRLYADAAGSEFRTVSTQHATLTTGSWTGADGAIHTDSVGDITLARSPEFRAMESDALRSPGIHYSALACASTQIAFVRAVWGAVFECYPKAAGLKAAKHILSGANLTADMHQAFREGADALSFEASKHTLQTVISDLFGGPTSCMFALADAAEAMGHVAVCMRTEAEIEICSQPNADVARANCLATERTCCAWPQNIPGSCDCRSSCGLAYDCGMGTKPQFFDDPDSEPEGESWTSPGGGGHDEGSNPIPPSSSAGGGQVPPNWPIVVGGGGKKKAEIGIDDATIICEPNKEVCNE